METIEKVRETIRLLKIAEEKYPGTNDRVLLHLHIWTEEESLKDPKVIEFFNDQFHNVTDIVEKDLEIVKIYLNILEPERWKMCPVCKFVYLTPWYCNGKCKKCKGDEKNDD